MSMDEYQPESPVYIVEDNDDAIENGHAQSTEQPYRKHRNRNTRRHRRYSPRRVHYRDHDIIQFVKRRVTVPERMILRRFPGIERNLRKIPNLRFSINNGNRIWYFYHFEHLCDDITDAIRTGYDTIDAIQSRISHRYASIRSAIDVLIDRNTIGIYTDSDPTVYFCT